MSHPPLAAEYKRYPICRESIKALLQCYAEEGIIGKTQLHCEKLSHQMQNCITRERAIAKADIKSSWLKSWSNDIKKDLDLEKVRKMDFNKTTIEEIIGEKFDPKKDIAFSKETDPTLRENQVRLRDEELERLRADLLQIHNKRTEELKDEGKL